MIEMPFPPASLSGHNVGHWSGKRGDVKIFRSLAWSATLKWMSDWAADYELPAGDIHITIRFIPPDNRGDRTNFPNRCKPIFDGIADALCVNDKRFVPHFEFAPAEKPGKLLIEIAT